jgi:hypothetical protein
MTDVDESNIEKYPESVQNSLRNSARHYGVTIEEACRRYEKITSCELSGTPVCVVCACTPSELSEYVEAAEDFNLTPEKYVVKEEGTYNKTNGHFLCTPCYIRVGQPSTDHGWVAP